MKEYTLEESVQRWEDQRCLKNLMGKYANMVLLNREGEIYSDFWSTKADVSLGFNDGYYVGSDAVRAYYSACVEREDLVSRLLQARFPERLGELQKEELHGIGPFKVYPLTAAIIEIAGDGETAKGMWSCQGTHNEVESCGPISRWTWGYFCVDFIREKSGWKIWHLQFLNDVDSVCGKSWGMPVEPSPDLPEFAPLKDFCYPEYSVKCTVREYYTPARKLTPPPEYPVPYEHFSETFSYGI